MHAKYLRLVIAKFNSHQHTTLRRCCLSQSINHLNQPTLYSRVISRVTEAMTGRLSLPLMARQVRRRPRSLRVRPSKVRSLETREEGGGDRGEAVEMTGGDEGSKLLLLLLLALVGRGTKNKMMK